jgi:hypothetical protein
MLLPPISGTFRLVFSYLLGVKEGATQKRGKLKVQISRKGGCPLCLL